jgi:hypothetical protein
MEQEYISTGRKASIKLLEAAPHKEKLITRWLDTIAEAYDTILYNEFYLSAPVKLPKGYVSKKTGKDEDNAVDILIKLNRFIGSNLVWHSFKEAKKEDHYIDDIVDDRIYIPFIAKNI